MTAGARGRGGPEPVFRELTPARWKDFEALFGPRGACGGCWCMWWRVPRSRWNAQKGDGNRRAFKKIVAAGKRPGVLAYLGGRPVAWCAVAPREDYPVLERSRTLARVDREPVWSVTCFYVSREHRGEGLTSKLLEEAKRLARKRGGRLLEGYPVVARRGRMADAFAWTGFLPAFEKAGFREVARRGARPILRAGVAIALPRPKTVP